MSACEKGYHDAWQLLIEIGATGAAAPLIASYFEERRRKLGALAKLEESCPGDGVQGDDYWCLLGHVSDAQDRLAEAVGRCDHGGGRDFGGDTLDKWWHMFFMNNTGETFVRSVTEHAEEEAEQAEFEREEAKRDPLAKYGDMGDTLRRMREGTVAQFSKPSNN
jgi:hypothetical protein